MQTDMGFMERMTVIKFASNYAIQYKLDSTNALLVQYDVDFFF